MSCALTRFSFIVALLLSLPVTAQDTKPAEPKKDDAPPAPAPDFPPFAEVSKGFDKVTSTADSSMYTLYKRDKDARLLAELPRDFEGKRLFVATTYAGGVPNTGIQFDDLYCYWKRYDKKLALIEPNIAVISTGDADNKRTGEKLYTDRVILEVPIAAMNNGVPVIDLSGVLVGQAEKFWGPGVARNNKSLVKITKCKAFPQNLEIAFEMPGPDGRLQTLHYSISNIPDKGGYQPREADPRVGYFTVSKRDIGKQDKDTQWVRYVTRWNVEKRDPKLQMSPPKQPIVFYLDTAIPVHYRRYVREGVLEWNKAFEKIGIIDAVECYQQDASTGQNMDKDPEDVRYNFIRWTSTDLGFSIGPSRVHPETGQILDADVVLDDGFIRGWFRQYTQLLPEVAMMSYSPEVIAWLDKNPAWDPRVQLAPPAERDAIVQQRALMRDALARQLAEETRQNADESGALPMIALRSGAPLQFGTVGIDPTGCALPRSSKSLCAAMLGKAMDMALLRMSYEDILALNDEPPSAGGDTKGDKKDEKKDAKKEQKFDGLPESFVGPLMRDLVAHEVGHTLGLRHNFKASTWKSVKEMNSNATKGKEPIVASVMDYTPLNINFNDGEIQGDYAPIGIGPYDHWAIEFGYGDGDRKEVLNRASEPALAYGTDEDLFGSDPLIKQFDLGTDSLEYADSTLRLVQHLRGKILDRVVKDGEDWSKARRAYELLLARHMSALRYAAGYIGGADVTRAAKGQPGVKDPVIPTDAAKQRKALAFLCDNTFKDEAFGLTRELLSKMPAQRWSDPGGGGDVFRDQAYQVHDRILGLQSAVLTMVLNPITLQRVYDNEFRVSPDADALTVPELMDGIFTAVWSEVDKLNDGTTRKPSISSFRRNLQRDFLGHMIDLTLPDGSFTAAYRPVQNITVMKLRELKSRIDKSLGNGGLDAYTKAHLAECNIRIGKALDATYVYNAVR